MAYSKRFPWLVGLAAAATVAALPAQAETDLVPTEATQPLAETVDFSDSGLDASATPSFESSLETPQATVDTVVAQPADADYSEIGTTANLLANPTVNQFMVVDQNSLLAFDTADIDTVLASTGVETAPAMENVELAQLTRGTYGGVSPAYLGVGGNIGIGDRDSSGVASFGFTVIGKISLGPRFSIRPAALITNQSSSFTVPVTYNFNTLNIAGFRMQPYAGLGVDIPTGSTIGLLVNAGLDVPISRDFTLNAVSNFRVTDGFGLGITFGVGYNFPFIFE
ncbi:MAG: hypothetical protein ACFCVD_05485 [Nodosilinea sp.]